MLFGMLLGSAITLLAVRYLKKRDKQKIAKRKNSESTGVMLEEEELELN